MNTPNHLKLPAVMLSSNLRPTESDVLNASWPQLSISLWPASSFRFCSLSWLKHMPDSFFTLLLYTQCPSSFKLTLPLGITSSTAFFITHFRYAWSVEGTMGSTPWKTTNMLALSTGVHFIFMLTHTHSLYCMLLHSMKVLKVQTLSAE